MQSLGRVGKVRSGVASTRWIGDCHTRNQFGCLRGIWRQCFACIDCRGRSQSAGNEGPSIKFDRGFTSVCKRSRIRLTMNVVALRKVFHRHTLFSRNTGAPKSGVSTLRDCDLPPGINAFVAARQSHRRGTVKRLIAVEVNVDADSIDEVIVCAVPQASVALLYGPERTIATRS